MKLINNKAATHANVFSRRLFRLCLLLVTVMSAAAIDAAAQSGDDSLQLAPPPLKMITGEERSLLNASGRHKERTKQVLDLMRSRVTAAEKLNTARDYPAMFTQLGGFHALMDDGIAYLQKLDNDDRKVLDTYKRLEIGLREFPPRLEAIRRDLPLQYEDYVRRLIRYLRVARTIATEPLFGDTVIPQQQTNENGTPKL